MKTTKNKLPATTRAQVVDMLNERLKHSIELYLTVREAHWNVKGKNFLSIHSLLGDIYGRLADQADDIAERISQLGGIAIGTKDIKPSEPGKFDSSNVVSYVSTVLAGYGADLLADFEKATALKDHGTANLLIDFCNFVDKDVWLLESHIE